MDLKKILTLAVAVLSFLMVESGEKVFANDWSTNAGCSLSTLNGAYAFYRTGVTPSGPLAAVGIAFFDGHGNFKGRQRISRNGVFEQFAFSAQYKVGQDCTGGGYSNGAEFFHFVVADGGNVMYGLSNTPGNAVYEIATRIQKQ